MSIKAPKGWKLVPVEATPEMLSLSRWSGSGDVSVSEEWARREVWDRMLANAPEYVSSGTRNRSAGSVEDYLAAIGRGESLDAIAARFGISRAAVHKALKSRGLPTCARHYLAWKAKESA